MSINLKDRGIEKKKALWLQEIWAQFKHLGTWPALGLPFFICKLGRLIPPEGFECKIPGQARPKGDAYYHCLYHRWVCWARAGAGPPDRPRAGHSVPSPSPRREEHIQILPKGTSWSDVVGSTQTTDFRRGRKKVMPQLMMPGARYNSLGRRGL